MSFVKRSASWLIKFFKVKSLFTTKARRVEKVKVKNRDPSLKVFFVSFVKRSASWLLEMFKVKSLLTTKARRVEKVKSKAYLSGKRKED